MQAVSYQLQKASDLGMLKDRSVLCGLLEAVGRNLHVKKRGKRYPAPVQTFFEVILMWGGPQLANFIAINIFGPELHSIWRWRKQKSLKLTPGISEENFIKLKQLYQEARKATNLPRAHVIMAEDETAITAHVDYCADTDCLVGFCGEKGENHSCKEACNIQVGDGEEGYVNTTNAFQTHKIGSLARAVIVNPLHPGLPKVPILIHSTCNKFDSAFVKRQWDELQRLYRLHLHDQLGPLISQV